MTRKLPSNNHNADILDRPIQNKTKTQDNEIGCTVNPKTSYDGCYRKSNHCSLSSLYVSIHYINSPLTIVSFFFSDDKN